MNRPAFSFVDLHRRFDHRMPATERDVRASDCGETQMSRYYFHVTGTSYGRDHEGSELSDWRSARVEALMLAAEIIGGIASGDVLDNELHIEVMDAAGMVLFRLDFSIQASAAMSKPLRSA